MAQTRLQHLRVPTRAEWLAGGATALAILVYFLVLGAMDGRAARYFEDLRTRDPATYLDQLRETKGFDAFLSEYAAIGGFAEFAPQTPNFLVGRWTMRPEPLRLTPGQAPAECTDPATFDYGLFLAVEGGGPALAVQYRIAGDTVEMRSGEGSVYPIRLVGYGANLDHVEFTPPGRTTPVFAYLCGR